MAGAEKQFISQTPGKEMANRFKDPLLASAGVELETF